MKRVVLGLLGLILVGGGAARADDRLPLFDAHLHYNWEPVAHFPVDKVVNLLRTAKVSGILATSRPNDGTHALVAAKPDGLRVVPFIRPYVVRADINTWFNDPKIYELIESEYQRGYFVGIGEFHIAGGATRGPWVKKMVDFAVAHDLILHAHADEEAIDILFAHNPKARIIWAHTGFGTPAAVVAGYLDRYPMLWGELSYRGGITDGEGKLTAEWRALFERYPDRFLVGSDTWVNPRWDTYESIMDGYRQWLAQLPRAAAEKIAYQNAERLFVK